MKAKTKTRPRTRTQATYTTTVRKIARHILLLASQRPQGELLDLTQSQIADALEVSERSVIRAMPLLRSGIEHTGRGFWRIVSTPALQAIALDPQRTPPHNDDQTPTLPLAPAPAQSSIPSSTPHLEDLVYALVEQVSDLKVAADASRLQIGVRTRNGKNCTLRKFTRQSLTFSSILVRGYDQPRTRFENCF